MTPDQLRTGAALVRCLVEGDNPRMQRQVAQKQRRLVLSDWIEEFGEGLGLSPQHQALVCRRLRSQAGRMQVIPLPGGTVSAHWWSRGRKRSYGITVGHFPLWAWEGREPTSEVS